MKAFVDQAVAPFVANLALQRHRLLKHAATVIGSDELSHSNPKVEPLAQSLLASLDLLRAAEEQWERDRAESEERQRLQETRIAHLSTMFDAAPTALVLTTCDSTIREVNAAARELFGLDSYALVGQPLFKMTGREEQAEFRTSLKLAIEMGSVAAWSFVLQLRRAAAMPVTATIKVVDDPAVGARAVYWNIRPLTIR